MGSKLAENKVTIKEKVISIGIDVHKTSWQITAVNSGEIILALTFITFLQ